MALTRQVQPLAAALPTGNLQQRRAQQLNAQAFTRRRDIFFAPGRYQPQTTEGQWLLAHELTHVVQSYPPGGPGWLVEGIADYVRLKHFEPKAPRPRVDLEKASYRDAYKTTAMFLEWAERKHDAKLVVKLNAALRQHKYSREMWREITGKLVDELWADYIAELRAKSAAPK